MTLEEAKQILEDLKTNPQLTIENRHKIMKAIKIVSNQALTPPEEK